MVIPIFPACHFPARAATVSGNNTDAASSHRLKGSENPRGAGLLRACTATSWTKCFLHRIPPAGVTNSTAVAFLLPMAPSTGPLTAENPGCLGTKGACLQNQGFSVHSSPERRMFPFLPAALCKLGAVGAAGPCPVYAPHPETHITEGQTAQHFPLPRTQRHQDQDTLKSLELGNMWRSNNSKAVVL